ncbi:MAG: TonB-dependent receptor [Bacteroidia bacterium]|nr:TonB-dependent receptor [Bacteroidia bacterium]
MKPILFLSFVIAIRSTLFAQDFTQTIRGTVIDKDSKQPLNGATVQLINETKPTGTITDEKGIFRIIKVSLGRKIVKISYLGYEDRLLSDIIVNSAKEVILNIEMIEKVISSKEIVVSAKVIKSSANNELVMVSGRSFTIDQTQRYAGGFGDPSRMAASFAGVAGGGNDQRNDIIIRGNSPTGLLWRFEGADIPNPNHFSSQGANGGPVSILNNNLLANSDFLTGAFPAEYGNANAGIFDLKMRNGNNEKREFISQLGFAGLELLAEGPLSRKKGSSYLISYRYSTLSIFNALGIKFGNSGIPQYQDLSFKFNFPQTKAGSFTLFGMGGISSTQLLDSRKTSEERLKLIFPQDVQFNSKMGVLGIGHLVQLGKKAYIKSVLTVSGDGNRALVDTLDKNNQAFYFLNRNTIGGKIAVHTFYNKKFNAKNTLKTGVIATRLNGVMIDSLWLNTLKAWYKRLDFKEETFLSQAYINYNYRIAQDVTFNAGLHTSYLFLNHTWSVDPRAGMRWQLSTKQSVSAGYGKHGQIQPLLTYFTRTLADTFNNVFIQTNKNVGMSQAQHFVLGYEIMINETTRIKAETYYQYLYNLPVTQNPSFFSTVNFGADFIPVFVDSLVNNGKGKNYGIEITLERIFSKGFYYLFTGSFYESKYQASDLHWRNTAFNGNFVINALAGKEWKVGRTKNNTLALNLKVTYAGGRRYIPIDINASAQTGVVVYDFYHAYQNRQKDFFRTDLKFSFKKNSKHFTQEFALDIQNIFNTQNILQQNWNPQTQKLQTDYQIGFFPVPFYRIYF